MKTLEERITQNIESQQQVKVFDITFNAVSNLDRITKKMRPFKLNRPIHINT